MKRLLRFYSFLLMLFLAGNQFGFAQQQQQIDSLKQALARYEKSKGQRPLDLRDTVMVNLCYKLGVTFLGGELKQAMFYATRQLEISQKIHFKKGIALAYNTIGSIYDIQSDKVKALKYFKESLKLSKQIGDKSAESDASANIGSLYGTQSNFTEALKYMLRSLAISKEINDKYGIVGAYNNIGVLQSSQGNYDEALKSYLSCLAMMKEIGNINAMGVICNNIGQMYALKGKPDEAINYLEKGLAFARRVNDKKSIANNYSGIGHVYTEKKQYDKALEYYQEALKVSEDLGDINGVARSYLTLGRTYFLIGNMNIALQNVNKAAALIKDDLEQLLNIYEMQSKIYEAKKDYRRAFESQLQFKQMSDSIYNTETTHNFDQLKLKYDFKSAQDSIKIVQAKKDILAQAEIKSQRNTRNFIVIVMGLIVFFLIILLWQRSKIAKVKRQRALDEERNRISRDLHDNLGAQLSAARMFMVSLTDSQSQNVSEIAGNSLSLLDASINDLRNVMGDIQDSVLVQKGYLAAAETLINKVNKLNNIQFSLTHHRMEERPNERIEHNLYRITQELINNTLKYSGAKNVSIDLLRGDDSLVLMYEDDGKGYDLQTVKRGDGLRNIQTRVKSLGGKVEFDSMPNAGARTIIEIPQ